MVDNSLEATDVQKFCSQNSFCARFCGHEQPPDDRKEGEREPTTAKQSSGRNQVHHLPGRGIHDHHRKKTSAPTVTKHPPRAFIRDRRSPSAVLPLPRFLTPRLRHSHGRFRRALLRLLLPPPLAGVQEAPLLPSPRQVPAPPPRQVRIAVAPPVASSGGEGRSGGPLRAVPLGPIPGSHHRVRHSVGARRQGHTVHFGWARPNWGFLGSPSS